SSCSFLQIVGVSGTRVRLKEHWFCELKPLFSVDVLGEADALSSTRQCRVYPSSLKICSYLLLCMPAKSSMWSPGRPSNLLCLSAGPMPQMASPAASSLRRPDPSPRCAHAAP